MHNRRPSRFPLKVVHLHRSGNVTRRQLSELVFLDGRPHIVLGFIDLGGVRAPLYAHDIDPAKLHSLGIKTFYRYDGVTQDPRRVERNVPRKAEQTTR